MRYAKQIEEYIQRLFDVEKQYHAAAAKAADLEAQYKVSRAVLYQDAKGNTVKEKESYVDQECDELYQQLNVAEANALAYKIAMENLRTAISATQSMMSAESKAHYVQDTMRQT